ncbi:hypothetical protein ACIP4S_16430 [Streptomyces chartreusis]|uniref:hypothetical protein n=1 Tax=Streptomyces chartreusis TaxID=1969 RepID=UPI0038142BAC
MNLTEYVKRCRELTGFWGAWPPSYPIKVGLVGSVDKDNVFRRIKELKDFPELTPPEIVKARTNFNESWYDGKETTVQTLTEVAADAQVHGAASLRVGISFKGEAGLFLAYSSAIHEQISDVDLLKRQILALAQHNVWQREWVAIVETISADHVTALASGGRDAEIVLNLKADLAAFQAWQLARADLGVSVRTQRSIGLDSIGKSGTPLYRTVAIRKSWPWKVRVELTGEGPSSDAFMDLPCVFPEGEEGVGHV